MNAFTIEHVLLWQKDTNTYADHDSESSKCIGALLIASSTDELNIQVNEKFDLLPILEKGGIVRLKLMLDNIIDVVPDKVIWTVNWLHYLNYEPIARTSSTRHLVCTRNVLGQTVSPYGWFNGIPRVVPLFR